MDKIILLISITILLTILDYCEPCCTYSYEYYAASCCCCCCCDYGWGYHSGWPPNRGCAPHRGGEWGGQRRRRRRQPLFGIVNPEIPVNTAIPAVMPPSKTEPRPKFLATIATAYEQPVCSGTIISSHFVMSTCVRCLHDNGTSVDPAAVRVMVVDLPDKMQRKSDHNFIIYETQSVTLHPGCVQDGKYDLKFDIGLVQTIDEIKFSSNVGPAKLPKKKAVFAPIVSETWLVASYDAEKSIRKFDDALTYMRVPTVESKECSKVLNSTFYNSTYNYCTPYHHDGRIDDCLDDFGAALAVDNRVYGLLIHKFACGTPGSAASYVSVPFNAPWIRKTVSFLGNGNDDIKI